MNKSVDRARRIDLHDLDIALAEALQRVSDANELSQAECAAISGGLKLEDLPPFLGYIIKEVSGR